MVTNSLNASDRVAVVTGGAKNIGMAITIYDLSDTCGGVETADKLPNLTAELVRRLHQAGKYVAVHVDGRLRGLLREKFGDGPIWFETGAERPDSHREQTTGLGGQPVSGKAANCPERGR